VELDSDIIARLSRAVPGTRLGLDNTLVLPASLIPTVNLLRPTSSLEADLGFVARSSFVIHENVQTAASTAERSQQMVTLGRGLWQLTLVLSLLSSFTQALTATPGENLVLNTAAVIDRIVMSLFRVVAQPQYGTLTFRILIDRDDLINVTHLTRATGVGETTSCVAVVIGEMLL